MPSQTSLKVCFANYQGAVQSHRVESQDEPSHPLSGLVLELSVWDLEEDTEADCNGDPLYLTAEGPGLCFQLLDPLAK